MSLHFFRISALDSAQQQEALNQFIAQNAVLDIEKQLVVDGQKSYWAVCVTTALNTKAAASKQQTPVEAYSKKRRASIDYKEVLSPQDFEVYAALRELRKTVAEAEGVPAYVIFTNAQLAGMVTQKVATKTALAAIDGIGEARVEKHADTFVACLQSKFASLSEVTV